MKKTWLGIPLKAGIVFIVAVFSTGISFTQEFTKPKEVQTPKCFGQGVVAFTAGYGYPSWGQVYFNLWAIDYGLHSTFNDYTSKGMGPLHFKAEIGLSKFIGMGLSVNYETYGGKWTKLYYVQANNRDEYFDENLTITSLSVMPRFNLHFATTNQIDPYFGVGAGYKTTTYKFHSDYSNALDEYAEGYFPVGLETTVGLRIYFSDSFGMYMEMGLAKSLVQGGIALKL